MPISCIAEEAFISIPWLLTITPAPSPELLQLQLVLQGRIVQLPLRSFQPCRHALLLELSSRQPLLMGGLQLVQYLHQRGG